MMIVAFHRLSTRLAALACCATIVAIAGCGPSESIHSYQVTKQELVEAANKVDPPAGALAGPHAMPGTAAAAKEPKRTLGAIVVHDAQGWFFKLTGPVEAVGALAEPFRMFLESVKFEKQEPTWAMPEGWKQLPGSGFRFATIEIADAKDLDFSVTTLPAGDVGETEYLLSNINRWRGQVNLSPITAAQLADESTKVSLAGHTATLVDLVGTGSAGGKGQPPFAGGPAAGPVIPPKVAGPAVAASNKPAALRFDAPKGWSPGRVNDMRKAAFEVKDGEQKLDITVIDLEAAAGDLLANINRWRDQVKLPEIDAQQLAKDARPIEIDGITGHYVELVGPESGGKQQTILGVVVKVAGRPWFIKLMGDGKLAEREKARFEEFVKSIKFHPAGAGNGQ